MHTIIAALAGFLLLAQADAAEVRETKPGAAASVPKIESIKPSLKAPLVEAAKPAAASAPKDAASASKDPAVSKEAAIAKEAAVAKDAAAKAAAAAKEAALQK